MIFAARQVLLILVAAAFATGESGVLRIRQDTMGMFSRLHADTGSQPNGSGEDPYASAVSSFPQQQTFWKDSSPFILLGSGIRYYKLGFIHVKVYGLALYVEQNRAMAEVARLKSQGFFQDGDTSVQRMCSAIGAMNVTKVVQMQLMRGITSTQLTDALAEALRPRLQGTPAYDLISGFEKYFANKSLLKDCNVPIMSTGNTVELDLMAPGNTNFAQLHPNEKLASPQFAAALFDIWLADDTPVTGAREQWAETLRQLVQNA